MVNKVNLKSVLLEQRQEIDKVLAKATVKRAIEDQVSKSLDDPLIKVVMGVRRCGKSALAHRVLKGQGYGYVNFDDERLIRIGTEDLQILWELLLEMNPEMRYVLLDEIQNVEGWELFVNRLHRQGYRVLITGSNSRLLSQELATHLTGRHKSWELYPFSLTEYLQFSQVAWSEDDWLTATGRSRLRPRLQQYVESGGFPETLVVESPQQYLRDLYDKILSRDVVTRFKVKYAKSLKEMAFFTMSNFSARASYRSLTNQFNFGSIHTAKNYLDYLQQAYLVFQLFPFEFSLKKHLRLPRKIYAIDTGMIQAVSLQHSPNYGRLVENVVFLELLRRRETINYFWDGTYEVDFVVQSGRQVKQLIQVMYMAEETGTLNRELKGLARAQEKTGCDNLSIITWDQDRELAYKGCQVQMISLGRWLSQR